MSRIIELDTVLSGEIVQQPRVIVEDHPPESSAGRLYWWHEWELAKGGEARIDLTDLHREMVCRALGVCADDDTLVDEVVEGTRITATVVNGELCLALSDIRGEERDGTPFIPPHF